MGITLGTLMFYGGIAGMVLCIVVVLLLAGIFKRQRERLLKQIEQETKV
jgi:hypothetical protein